VIGIVDAVSKHYSFAISFLNKELNISARLDTSGAVGPLAWDGISTSGAVLKEIPLQYKYNPGDTVYTSGYSAIFPPDIPLGVITGSGIQDGTMYDIYVTLLEDQAALRYVTIVDHTGRDEIIPLEQMEEEDDEDTRVTCLSLSGSRGSGQGAGGHPPTSHPSLRWSPE
jgi:rod shape-determining protein MreC